MTSPHPQDVLAAVIRQGMCRHQTEGETARQAVAALRDAGWQITPLTGRARRFGRRHTASLPLR